MQVDKFLNMSGRTIFYGGLVRLLDKSHFMGVVPLISGHGFQSLFVALCTRFFLQPQYLKIPGSAPERRGKWKEREEKRDEGGKKEKKREQR